MKSTKNLKVVGRLDISFIVFWLIATICMFLIAFNTKQFLNIDDIVAKRTITIDDLKSLLILIIIIIVCVVVCLFLLFFQFIFALTRINNPFGRFNLLLVIATIVLTIISIALVGYGGYKLYSDLSKLDFSNIDPTDVDNEITNIINDTINKIKAALQAPSILALFSVMTAIASTSLCFVSARKG